MDMEPYFVFKLSTPKDEDYFEIEKCTKQHILDTNPKQEKAYGMFERGCKEFFDDLSSGNISSELMHCLKSESAINRKEYEELLDSDRLYEIAQQKLREMFINKGISIESQNLEEVGDNYFEVFKDFDTTSFIGSQIEAEDEIKEGIPNFGNTQSINLNKSREISASYNGEVSKTGLADLGVDDISSEHFFKDYPFKNYASCKFKYFKYKGQLLDHYSMRQLLLHIIEATFQEYPADRLRFLSEFESGSYRIVTGKVTGPREKEYSYIQSQNISVKTKLGAEAMFRFINKIFNMVGILVMRIWLYALNPQISIKESS